METGQMDTLLGEEVACAGVNALKPYLNVTCVELEVVSRFYPEQFEAV